MWTLLYRDLWFPIWLNLAAALPWAPAVWHHRRIRAYVSDAVARATGQGGSS